MLTKEERQARARKAAAARWATKSTEERQEHGRMMAGRRTADSDLKVARTIAAKHGYVIVQAEVYDRLLEKSAG